MFAHPIEFLELLNGQVQYVVPRWQRRYCWGQSDMAGGRSSYGRGCQLRGNALRWHLAHLPGARRGGGGQDHPHRGRTAKVDDRKHSSGLHRCRTRCRGPMRRVDRTDHSRRSADQSREAPGKKTQADASERRRGRVPARPRRRSHGHRRRGAGVEKRAAPSRPQ